MEVRRISPAPRDSASFGPFDGIAAGGLAAAGGEDFAIRSPTSLRIDGEHDGLRAETFGDRVIKLGIRNGGGVDG